MKKFTFTLTVILIFLFNQGFSQLATSAHDFTNGDAWNTNTSNKMCGVCHTPHNANTSVAEAPLWNHALSAVATYTLYGTGSATLDATINQPSSVSKLCLACHDGTVALDNGPLSNATMIGTVSASANVGTDLSGDHPISFTYNDALATADGGLHPTTTTVSGMGGMINADMLFGAGNDQMECSSCHDVHNSANIAGLLLKTNTNSELCLTCHDK
jgi:predicted CXXCH cytochrome family protein